jgi:hypothetical protein
LNTLGKGSFKDLPTDETILRELTFGVMAAYNNSGEVVGLYQLDPTRYQDEQQATEAVRTSPKTLFHYSHEQQKEIDPDQLSQFLADYPKLASLVTSGIPSRLSSAIFPLPAYYQLWEYSQSQSPEARLRLESFMKEYGGLAVYSFLTGEYGSKNIDTVIRFAMEAQEPKVSEEDGITTIRLYESFSEQILRKYASLAFDSWLSALRITPIPEHAIKVRDLTLQRAKAMLTATAKLHEQRQASGEILSGEDMNHILLAFDFQQLLLEAVADPEGKLARSMDISYEVVRDFFRFHDPSDPDSKAFFNNAGTLV